MLLGWGCCVVVICEHYVRVVEDGAGDGVGCWWRLLGSSL